MGRKWNIRIGTGTTPRKQSAIHAAREGRMLQRHWDYVKPIYLASLMRPLRDILPMAIPSRDVEQFAEECIEDAFVRIKEFEEGKYKFRTFLVKKVIFPRMSEFLRSRKQRFEKLPDENELFTLTNQNHVITDFRYYAMKAFMQDAMRELKKDSEIQYEIILRRIVNNLSYKEIYDELKGQYTLTITSEAAVRVNYQRAATKLKHYLREIYKRGKYLDKELPLRKWFIERLRAETTTNKDY